jgi:hypothetical protein
MPVKFTDYTLVETHVHTSKLDTHSQLSGSCLAGPSTFLRNISRGRVILHEYACHLNSDVRIRKAPPHICHISVISAWRPHEIWALAGTLPIPWSQHRCTQSISIWQGI